MTSPADLTPADLTPDQRKIALHALAAAWRTRSTEDRHQGRAAWSGRHETPESYLDSAAVLDEVAEMVTSASTIALGRTLAQLPSPRYDEAVAAMAAV